MHYLAVRLAELLVKNSDCQFNKDEIRYGLEIFLGAAFQILIILGIAAFLGLGEEVFIMVFSAAILRRYSGGVHCQAYYRCTLCSIFVFVALGYLVKFIDPNYFTVYFPLVILVALIIVLRKAPVDNPINPISDINERRKIKTRSAQIMFILFLIAGIFNYFNYSIIADSILLGIIWQVFTLTSWGHILISLVDHFFGAIESTFLRKEGYNEQI